MIRGSKSQLFTYCKWIPVTALSCFLGASIATSAHAEQDFEYAKLLMERDEQSFTTDDIIERLIAKLLDAPATQLEGKLVKATFLRRQAGSSSAEKKNKLLAEANDLYKEVLAGDKKFRLMSVAERDAASMTSEMIRAQIALAGNDKNAARDLRAKAAANQEIIANAQKTAIDAAEPKFIAEFTKYTEYVKAHTDQESQEVKPPYPSAQMDALMKTFDEWIISDKRYVAAKVEQIECYDDSDPAKKATAEVMAKYCEERINNEKLADFPVITSWYSFMQGRIYAKVGDEEKAGASWGTALQVEMPHLNDDQRKQMFQLKKFIIHDLIKMNMKSKKYAAVEEYIATSMIDPVLRTLFDDDSGKDLLVDYSKALTYKDGADQSDVEKAIKKLREQIEKEKGNTMWAATFSRAMADVLDFARSHKGMMPRLSGQEWYDAARGFFVKGQAEHQKYVELERDAKGDPKNKDQFELAYAEFQNAVDFYRRAVTASRNSDLLTRVTVEPKAWFEMGLCYLKMRHYYEAIVVYQAMRNTFLPEFRSKLLPDPTSPEYKKQVTKAVKDALDELDKPKEGLIAKSGSNVLYAFEENKKLHNGAGDMWNKALQGKILSTDTTLIKDSGITDIAYTQARTLMDEAKSFSDNGKFTAKDPKLSEDAYGQALTKYSAAAEKFLKVAPASDAYEIALFQAGCCYNYAQGIWSDKLPSRPKADVEAAVKDLGTKGVAAFDKYIDYVNKNAAKKDEDKDRRKKLEGEVLLVRNALNFGMQDWTNTLKSADEYLAWEKDNTTNSKKDAALLNKFVALISLAAQNFAPKSDPFLKDAEATMLDVRTMKPKDNKLYRTMLDQLGRRYNIAAFQIDKFLKEGHTDVSSDMQDAYEDKVAEIQLLRVTVVEEEATEEVSLEDYSRIVYLFDKASHRVKDREKATAMQEKSAEMAKKLLEKYDPTKKNLRIPEDKDAWQPLLVKMIGDGQTSRGLLRIQDDFKGDITRLDQCKRDHATLVDYMYDTVPQDTPADKRPDYDKQKTDLEKARQQLKTIKDNYPNIPTLNDKAGNASAAAIAAVNEWIDAMKTKFPEVESLRPKKGEPGKSPLQIIEEEIDFRRKIEATRDLLSRQSLELAEKYAKAGNNDNAKKFREMASEQIKILGELRGDTPVMMEQTAELDMADGKYKEAEDTLWKIADNAEKDSDTYFRAKRKLSEIFANQKKWREAAEFPEYIALIGGVKGNRPKRLWPDMASFLEECYKNGAPRPAALKLDGSDDVKDVKDVKKDDAPKTDAPKADAPKTDEKKADEPKADAPKADEPKADAPKDAPKADEKKADEKKAD